MISSVHLMNFRAARDLAFAIAPMTVLTGRNNSGKSTLMYGLLAAKNIVSTPAQPVDSFFNFVFLNLGGFKESVFLKEEDHRDITVRMANADVASRSQSAYEVTLGKRKSRLRLTLEQPSTLELSIDVTFPYALGQSTGGVLRANGFVANVTWNGVSATVSVEREEGSAVVGTVVTPDDAVADFNTKLTKALNWPIEELRKIDFVPLRRGFIDPVFSPVPVTQLISEKEIATLVANDPDLEARISFYLEQILGRNFRVRGVVGTANFFLRATERATGFDCDLVNEGFGTNQLVYILGKALQKDRDIICIEEPEIHLNPEAVIKLAEALLDIARRHKRRFLISTHSEHFVVSLLNRVARGAASADDLKLYYLRKDGEEAVIEEQHVNEKGQIRGGLRPFYDVELSQLREFLQIQESN